MIVLWVVSTAATWGCPGSPCLALTLFIAPQTFMRSCGDLDLGTEQKTDVILIWINSMISFIRGKREGKREWRR